jgi:hypothetical protein
MTKSCFIGSAGFLSTLLLLSIGPSTANRLWGQTSSGVFHNERLKTLVLPGPPLLKEKSYSFGALASGFWAPDSDDPKKALVLPQQVKIWCSNSSKECTEISVTLGPVKEMVGISDIDTTTYDVDKWDVHGLTASFGGGASSRCQRHVLTIDFDSGAVSVNDIPTRKAGCEAFTETDSYKLVRGQYYIDTTPGNDLDKKKS